jgi:hypothetical protein
MTRPHRLVLAVAGLVAATSGHAFEAQCPQTVETAQRLSAPPPAGWSEFSRDPWGTAGDPSSDALRNKSAFSHIEIYDGPPKEIADLIPDNQRDTWTLGDPAKRARPQFMACAYGGTYVRLVRELPANVVKCHAAKSGKLTCTQK